MSGERAAQLEYSEFQAAMLDEDKRRRKAAKIISVLAHFLGRDAAEPGQILSGLTVGDVGCSAGFIADELAAAGARHTLGVDIDVPGLRKASERFGARVVGIGFNTLDLSIAAPPATTAHALRVAAEHWTFCPDSILQGPGTLADYAEQIVGQNAWSFWWD